MADHTGRDLSLIHILLVWGLCLSTITIPFMVWRLATREVTPAFCHTQAIVLAPCSLCLASYLNLAQEPSMALVGILFFCVLASLAFIIIKLPVFFAVPFAPGFAGLTFPMAIGIVASNKAAAFFTGAGQETLGSVSYTHLDVYKRKAHPTGHRD